MGATFTKQTAFDLMKSGKKVTHDSFLPGEYLCIRSGTRIETKDGDDFTNMFWRKNIGYYEHFWSEFKDKT